MNRADLEAIAALGKLRDASDRFTAAHKTYFQIIGDGGAPSCFDESNLLDAYEKLGSATREVETRLDGAFRIRLREYFSRIGRKGRRRNRSKRSAAP